MPRLTEYTRDGLTFDVTDVGALDGPAVVLLHGFPAHRGSWWRVQQLLADRGIRSLAPDQRGYSPRARPEGRGAYRTAELGRDVLALLDAAELDRAHVVGHDWGGFVAWQLAASAPERVPGLVAVATPHPFAMTRSMLTSTQALRSAYMGFFQLPGLPERALLPRLEPMLTGMGLDAADARSYAARMRQPGALTAALNWYRAMWLPNDDPELRADVVRVPTTYVWASRDAPLGPRAAHYTARYVDAPYRFVALSQGHWLPENAPTRLTDEIEHRLRDGPKHRAAVPLAT